ncbi:MAG: hypothetical protein LIO81_01610 [Clostridiales bacterium]|nr:hypothetical protein [Clostridiales bacterium]
MRNVRLCLKMLLVLLFGTVAGVALLCLVFLIPSGPVYEHVRDSVEVFEIEGTYPAIQNKKSKALDNWTDALILCNSFYEKENAGILDRAMNIYRPEYDDANPVGSLTMYMAGLDGWHTTSYTRYWHGYLLFTRPLLLLTDYLGFRGLNKILLVMFVVMLAVLLLRQKHKLVVVPFLLSVLFLRPEAVAFSLQYSSVFYIMCLALLVELLWNDHLQQKDRYVFYFLIVGIVTNYFDLLTYPIATLGVPLAMWLVLQTDFPCIDRVKSVILYSLSWGFGYFGMWAMKWSAASLALGKNAFADAMMQAQFRLSDQFNGVTISFRDVQMKNIWIAEGGRGGNIVLPIIVITIGMCVVGLWRSRMNVRMFLAYAMPFLLVSLMPFAWYVVLRNHSYIHTFFTYRALVVSVFSILCLGFTVPRKEK